MHLEVDDAKQRTTSAPVHVGIIMDGNGRWAERRKLPRSAGHREGLKTAKRIVRAASEIGVQFVTLYTFSTENWRRDSEEVGFLMRLVGQNLRKEYDFYREHQIRVVHSGNLLDLPEFVQREVKNITKDTAQFSGMVVNLAINYGGRDEIIRSINRWLEACRNRSITPGPVSEPEIRSHLDHPEIPDPDLIIRTGDEKRFSNFLLWEGAYAEYYFSSKLWPDWKREDFLEAVENFNNRNRKYGGHL